MELISGVYQEVLPLDKFLLKFLHENGNYGCLWKVYKIVLTLFHGQASVECGFSISKEVVADKQEEFSLNSEKIFCDGLILLYIQSQRR